MIEPSEAARLRSLADFQILDTPPEEAFDRLTALAADLFDTPIALVSLIDEHRQWFKSRQGLEAASTPRSLAFCAHAIAMGPNATMVVEDASADPRFNANPLVTTDPNIRFYAGAVLTSRDGANLGTLCVIDTKPRPAPSPADLRRLSTLAGIVVDELELRRANRLANERQSLLEMAERVSGVGRWRYDVASGAVDWSEEVYRIHGVDPATYDPNLDRALDFFGEEDKAHLAALIAVAIETGQGYEIELSLRLPTGAVRDVIIKAGCVCDAQGRVIALSGVFQDFTERKAYETELARARDVAEEKARRAAFAEAVAGLGHWRLDAKTQEIEWSAEMYRIYGLPPDEPIQLVKLLAMTHPDDARAGIERRARQFVDGGEQKMLSRIVRTDGELRHLEGTSRAERDASGEIVALVGTLIDVTEKRAAEVALANSELRFRTLTENAPDIIAETQLDGTLTYVSPACLKITGFSAEELVGRTSFSLMNPDDAAKMMAMCQAVFVSNGAVAPWSVEFRARHKSGHEIWLESKPTLVRDQTSGRFVGLTDVIRDVSVRKALESQLRHARAEAEAATAVKSEFLANMSHELRTPLTSILGFTRLAQEQSELATLTRTYVDRVADASRALLCTVNDVLDFSKLEAGQVSFHPEPTSIHKLGRATLDLFMPQAGAKDLTLSLEGFAEDDDFVVRVDPDRIRQVLLNFVSNAVKFTAAGGVTMRIGYDSVAASLLVEVIDTGAGVPADKLERLFKRFSQIDGSLTRAQSGTGLGLAICKGLVEAMGGEVGVTSVAGEGSRFWFRVPAALASLPRAENRPAGIDQPTFAGIRVLVVDDHPGNRELARLFLAGVGAEITEARDGEEAVEMAMALPYDVILMDMRMPKLDGAGALRKIRSAPGPNDATPVLAFTADADPEAVSQLTGLGFDGVVHKPIDSSLLIGAVAKATAFAVADFQFEDDADVA